MRMIKATARDAGEILAMMGEYYAYDGLAFNRRTAARRLRTFLAHPAQGRAWVVRSGAATAGYVLAIRGFGLEHGRNVLIDECYLREVYRRRGWGRAIVQRVKAYACGVGAESLHAQVERHNRPACRFWTRMGFRPYDRWAMVRLLARSGRRRVP